MGAQAKPRPALADRWAQASGAPARKGPLGPAGQADREAPASQAVLVDQAAQVGPEAPTAGPRGPRAKGLSDQVARVRMANTQE